MIRNSIAFGVVLLVAATLPVLARAEHTRVTHPNALGVEVLGRGMTYSVYFDRVMDDHLVAGFGFGTARLKNAADENVDETAKFVPVYVNYYFAQEQGSLFATGGVTLVTNAGDIEGLSARNGDLPLSDSPIVPVFGVGYENRGDSGFLFRLAAYGMVGDEVKPWVGFSFGYAF